MATSAPAGDSEFGAASPDFMRSVLDISGQLFADMSSGARTSESLRYLCDAVRGLLGAEDVVLRLHEDGIGLWGEFESHGLAFGECAQSPDYTVDIGGTLEPQLGQLEITWTDPDRLITPLDQAVAGRFSTMALLVLDRHLTKRRQLQAVAQEREALAGEIHDDTVQILTAASLQLQRVVMRLDDGEDRSAIRDARSLNDNAIERLRHVMFSLYPSTLSEDGLVVSIEAYCESFVEIEGLAWTITGSAPEDVPLEVAALAFRLCRNALVNVIQHAEANSVSVDVSCAVGLLRIVVRDDGIGFEMAQVRHTRVGHLGIPHAVTLARWVAGTYVTESEQGRGTTVTIELPIF